MTATGLLGKLASLGLAAKTTIAAAAVLAFAGAAGTDALTSSHQPAIAWLALSSIHAGCAVAVASPTPLTLRSHLRQSKGAPCPGQSRRRRPSSHPSPSGEGGQRLIGGEKTRVGRRRVGRRYWTTVTIDASVVHTGQQGAAPTSGVQRSQ